MDIENDYPFINVPEELLLSLGKVNVNFNAVDNLLSVFIGSLINFIDSHPAYIATSELSFKAKLGVLMSEYEIRVDDPNKCEELRELLGKLRDIEITRNNYFHSFYTDSHIPFKKEDRERIHRLKPTSKMNKGFSLSHSYATSKEFNECSERIKLLGKHLSKLFEEYCISESIKYAKEQESKTEDKS